jgi:FtsZ-interacting cell division protein ZipA
MTTRTWIILGGVVLLTLIVVGFWTMRSPEPLTNEEPVVEEPTSSQVEDEEISEEFQDNLDDAFTDLELIES